MPSKFVQLPHSSVGRSLYPKVGGSPLWQLLSGEPPLPPELDVARQDLRAQIRPDTSSAFHGRHALRLMVPASNVSAVLPVPLKETSYGSEGTAMNWTLRFRVRASPAVATILIVSGGCYIGGGVKNSSGWFGAYYVRCPQPKSHGEPTAVVGEVWGSTTADVGPDWKEFKLLISNATMWSHNLWLNVSTSAELGTRIWLDAVTLTNHSASTP